MNGELGVVTVHCDQFRPVGLRAHLPGHRCLLGLQVPEEARRGQLGNESVGVVDQLGAASVSVDDLLVRDEEGKQDGGVAGERESAPLARRIDDYVEVTVTGAIRQATGLSQTVCRWNCSKSI